MSVWQRPGRLDPDEDLPGARRRASAPPRATSGSPKRVDDGCASSCAGVGRVRDTLLERCRHDSSSRRCAPSVAPAPAPASATPPTSAAAFPHRPRPGENVPAAATGGRRDEPRARIRPPARPRRRGHRAQLRALARRAAAAHRRDGRRADRRALRGARRDRQVRAGARAVPHDGHRRRDARRRSATCRAAAASSAS